MSYVLEITDDNGEIKYVSTGTATSILSRVCFKI